MLTTHKHKGLFSASAMQVAAVSISLFACKHAVPALLSPKNSGSSPPPITAQHSNQNDDRDMDGLRDAADQCPDEPEDLDDFEDKDGCPDRDNDDDGILDAHEFVDGRWTNCDYRTALNGVDVDCRNLPEDHPGAPGANGCPDTLCLDQCDSELAEHILFDSRGRLGAGAVKVLDTTADMIRASSNVKFRVEAHADQQSSSRAAKRVHQRVLSLVIEQLVARGVDRGRLTPVDKSSSLEAQGLAKSPVRRIEFHPECRCQNEIAPSEPLPRICR